ncbi:MAG: pyruvate formate lyase family protein [Bacteroidales bacterium]|nr:pyruvate formate lyase family protein [Bacteroidales bacterium]
MLSERIQKLRETSLNAVNRLSAERALLITEFYAEHTAGTPSVPVHRALAFEHLLRHKQLSIQEGELIVGERGPAPKATPTYPEISLHSLKDIEVLDSREKVSFRVDKETYEVYRDKIIPFWEGRTNRDRIFERMTKEWVAAYEAGVFTEFQEQRAPGHTVLGKKIYERGLLDLVEEIDARIAAIRLLMKGASSIGTTTDGTTSGGVTTSGATTGKTVPDTAGNMTQEAAKLTAQVEELEAMKIAAEAMIMYAERNAALLRDLAGQTQDARRRSELLQMEKVCRKVPAHAPETMHEALQYYWFVHLGVISELNPWDAFNPGRLDQHLLPFYERDLAKGRLTEASARELLQAFWIKFNNHPSPPKMGVTAQESSTYTDFCLINLGGLKEDGSDAVNEMSFLLLDVIEEMRLLQPSSMIQVSRRSPDSFVDRAIQIVKTGFGQPSIFNTDAIVQELLNQGKSILDARNGGASGCVESGAFGTEAYWLTGYFNLVKVLELTLHNGLDPRTGRQVGIRLENQGGSRLEPKTSISPGVQSGNSSGNHGGSYAEKQASNGSGNPGGQITGKSGATRTEALFETGEGARVSAQMEPQTGTALDRSPGARHGAPVDSSEGGALAFESFEALQEAFRIQLNYLVDIKIAGNVAIERLFAEHLPVPFLSLFIDDCIQNGKDYNAGGARYNTSYIQGVGLGSVTDMFTALKTHVYERKTISPGGLMKVLEDDFEGHEAIRAELIYKTPKYGNDDDTADVHATWVFEQFHAAVDGKPNHRGGVTRINMLPTTSHVYFGSVVGATADGRHAGEPLSEGISPVQGTDTHGPTAVLKSAAKIDHLKTGGTLLNQKFTPGFFRDERSVRKITQLVRGYFGMMGHHIQFNVVSADTLRDAQQHPEKYRDLIVRVAGYSDYFNDLGTALQNEIIRRTEQEL